MDWIDNADSYKCPVCGYECDNPNRYNGQCLKCGFVPDKEGKTERMSKHGRLIDADALIDKYGDWYTEEGTEEGYIGTIKGIVDSMPTIEPQRKGKWIKTGQSFVFPEKFRNYSCSECGYDVEKIKFNFCPNCGADMRGEQE